MKRFIAPGFVFLSCFVLPNSTVGEPREAPAKWVLLNLDGDGEQNIRFARFMRTAEFSKDREPVDKLPYDAKSKGPLVRQYEIQFLDHNDRAIQTTPFTVDLTGEVPPELTIPKGKSLFESEQYPFFFLHWVPFPESTRAILLKQENRVLARKDRSPKPPALITGPPNRLPRQIIEIPWTLRDEDSDQLGMDIGYSFDGTASPLLTGCVITLRPRFRVDFESGTRPVGDPQVVLRADSFRICTAALPGGKECRFLFTVTDGLNVAEVATEPFAMGMKPPEISVSEPEDGATFKENDPVEFSAWAFYQTGGSDRDFTVTWHSSIDGVLGAVTGLQSLSLRNLSPGRHTISARADDGKGCRGEKTVTITVEGSGRPSPTFRIAEDDVKLSATTLRPGQDFTATVTVHGESLRKGVSFQWSVNTYRGQKRLFSGNMGTRVDDGQAARNWTNTFGIPGPREPGTYRVEAEVQCEFERPADQKDNRVVRMVEVTAAPVSVGGKHK